MVEYDQLLVIAQNAARKAIQVLVTTDNSLSSYRFDDDLPREMKSAIDCRLEEAVLDCLKLTEIPILSEESGEHVGSYNVGLRWIIDPLDGTVNFIRGIAPCAVSIALWLNNTPVFGVISEYPSCRLAWGGQSFGSFVDGMPIRVSTIKEKNKAIICTGFSSRFDFSRDSIAIFLEMASSYAKVRMLGAASLSLLHVAKGSADAYSEQDVMIWDVAAGLAIVEGAGGCIRVLPGKFPNSHNIFADNNLI
jgi:myo-inositol-1(or 4)-monophosphatase